MPFSFRTLLAVRQGHRVWREGRRLDPWRRWGLKKGLERVSPPLLRQGSEDLECLRCWSVGLGSPSMWVGCEEA
ncbi:unnamed protein product [Prunus armeniaca]